MVSAIRRCTPSVLSQSWRSPRSWPTAPTATPVARVSSPTVAQIVQRVLEVSDNAAAEILLRQAGVADQGEGSFEGGRAAVERTLAANGIPLAPSVLYDGSGLSPSNRLTANTLAAAIRLALSDETFAPVIAGLIVISLVFTWLNPVYIAPNNLVNLLFDCATVGFISLGIVCVLMLGEIDLSVGSMLAFTASLMSLMGRERLEARRRASK